MTPELQYEAHNNPAKLMSGPMRKNGVPNTGYSSVRVHPRNLFWAYGGMALQHRPLRQISRRQNYANGLIKPALRYS